MWKQAFEQTVFMNIDRILASPLLKKLLLTYKFNLTATRISLFLFFKTNEIVLAWYS